MKKNYSLLLVGVMALLPTSRAATLNVTTTAASGAGSLDAAITALNDGDTIAFNIPGAGPHYIHPPAGGFQIIQKNDITIDGYTQPGSSPNTNPILAANNANLKIVLKANDGEFTDLTALGIGGFTDGEGAILAAIGSTTFNAASNFTVRGLCFMGDWVDSASSISEYGIALGGDAVAVSPHISGCRFGLDPDNTTVGRLKDGIAYFGGGVQDLTIGVAAGPANAVAARAQFNIFIGMYISFIGDSGPVRVSGNFFNVYPDGLHDYNINSGDGDAPNSMEAMFELGGNNLAVIGTDGDGVNDAEERNIFGGATDAGDSRIMEWYGGSPTNTVIAGNYIGVAIDGGTRFTNGGPNMQLFESIKSLNVAQIGSDFDGVSDDLEANVISWNYPFATLYPNPTDYSTLSKRWHFGKIDNGAALSLRGNKMIGNVSAPYTYFPEDLAGDATRLENYTNYVNTFMVPAGDYNTFVAILASTNVYPSLNGVFSPGLEPYTNIVLDVYQLDPEGWANGQQFAFPELMNLDGTTNGFPQGKKYLGSFPVPNTGSFSVNLSGLDLGLGAVTVAANYSADPAGTHRGRTITANFSNPGYVLPGGAPSASLTQVVPDVACWFDTTLNTVTNGFIKLANQPASASLGNWEPFISSLGDSTFLIEFNTYANDGTFANQNNAVVKQPAAGGAAKVDYAYYADNGTPFPGALNLSRQNGNPGRVAGDLRYGASKFITECEASLGQLPEFQSAPNRWLNNNIFQDTARYCAAQVFNLDPATLTQTPVTKAWEFVYGPYVGSMGAAADTTQVERTGGRPNFLDNGNIVVMIDDKAAIASPVGEVTTFAIIQPDGTIVKGPTLAKEQNIFDNMCAVKNGFVIRVHNSLLFYDNNGSLTYSNDVNQSSGMLFGGSVGGLDGDRGDGTRINGDIRSYYVYLAAITPNNSIGVAAWDTRTGQFVGGSTVTDGDPTAQGVDRCGLAVDALNRVCVAYMYKPTADFVSFQVAARVAQFDGANFKWQTHSFFPFVNHDENPSAVLGYLTANPYVAMNTRQICIAAKGTINSTNSATAGPDSLTEQTVYTVISQPVPVAAPQPVISMAKSGNNLNLSWNAEDGLFTVQTSSSLVTPITWNNATAGNVAPPVSIPAGTGPLFVRLVR